MEIEETLAREMKEHTATLVRLTKIPRVDLTAAQGLLADMGPSAATFDTAERFASRVGVSPRTQESAGV
jgi:hypothetical protein